MKKFYRSLIIWAIIGFILLSQRTLAGPLDLKMVEQNAAIIEQLYQAYQKQKSQYNLQFKQYAIASNQLHTMMNQYKNLTQQLDILKRNLTAYGNLDELSIDTKKITDTSAIKGDLSKLYYLDPKNTQYQSDQSKIFNDYYVVPPDPELITQQYSEILSAEQLQALSQQARQQYGKFNQAKDLVALTQQQVGDQQQRAQTIDEYNNRIQTLGDDSQLATSHVEVGELLLLAQQQEEILKSLRNLQQIQETERLEKISAQAEQSQAERDRVMRVSQNISPVTPLDSWGDM